MAARAARGLLLAGVAVRSFFFLVALASSAGCIPEHRGAQANGEAGQLEFGGLDAAHPTAGVGLPLDVSVARFDPQWITCLEGKGGEVCGAPKTEPIALVDARCDDDACDVAPTAVGGSVQLRVVGRAPGATTLRVSVKSANDDAHWADAIALSFAPVSRVRLTHAAGQDPDTARFAVMPGAKLAWTAVVESVAGDGAATPLEAARDAVSATASTDAVTAVVDSGHVSLVAAHPGVATITVTAAGVSAQAAVRVGDAADVTGIELHDTAPPPSEAVEIGSAGDDAVAPAPLASVTLRDDGPFAGGRTLAVVLALRGGDRALGGAALVSGEPAELLFVNGSLADGPPLAQPWLFVAAQASGHGTLAAAIGPATLALPVDVATASDAGSD